MTWDEGERIVLDAGAPASAQGHVEAADGFWEHTAEAVGLEKREEHPDSGETAVKVGENVHEGIEGAEGALEGTHAGHLLGAGSGILSGVLGAMQIGNGVEKLDHAKSVDEGNKGVDDMVQGVGDIADMFGPAGKAVGAGIKAGGKIARWMEDTSKDLDLYGDKRSLSEHAASVGLDADGSNESHNHRDANGVDHMDVEYGPTVGGALATVGQTVVDAVTFLPRMIGKGVGGLVDALFGPSDEERAHQALVQTYLRQGLQEQEMSGRVQAVAQITQTAMHIGEMAKQFPEGSPERERCVAMIQGLTDNARIAAGPGAAAEPASAEQP